MKNKTYVPRRNRDEIPLGKYVVTARFWVRMPEPPNIHVVRVRGPDLKVNHYEMSVFVDRFEELAEA